MNHNDPLKKFYYSPRYRRSFFIFMALGALALIAGFAITPTRTWMNILININYYLTLTLSGGLFMAIHYLTKARWSEAIIKLPMAVSSFLPYTLIFFITLIFGMHSLFHWSNAEALQHDALLQSKSVYLNTPFFVVRDTGIVGLLSVLLYFMRKNDCFFGKSGDMTYYNKNVKLSAVFLIFFAFGISILSCDLLMSLSPHWYSTVFAVYNFSGLFVNGIVVITLMAIVLTSRGNLPLNENHFHDLGKLIFAFSLFWAYIWFSQFMLIWYANIPEETVYFVTRLKNDWDWLFYFNFFINFVVPFFMLLPRSSKRSPAVLGRVCLLLLIGRWLDLYLLIAPSVFPAGTSIGILEITVSLGFAGLFMHVVLTRLQTKAMLNEKSQFLIDSLHYHQ